MCVKSIKGEVRLERLRFMDPFLTQLTDSLMVGKRLNPGVDTTPCGRYVEGLGAILDFVPMGRANVKGVRGAKTLCSSTDNNRGRITRPGPKTVLLSYVLAVVVVV